MPGLGQLALGARARGWMLLALAAGAVGLVLWLDRSWVWLALAPFWLLQALDARRLAGGRAPANGWLALAAALPIYLVGWIATEIQPGALVAGFGNVQPLFQALASPELLCRPSGDTVVRAEVTTPCPVPSPTGPATSPAGDGPRLAVTPACADLRQPVVVAGSAFPAGADVRLEWESSQGNRQALATVTVAPDGSFSQAVTVPEDSVPLSIRLAAERSGQPIPRQTQAVVAVIPGPAGPPGPCPNALLVLRGMGVTIALGYLATLFGALLAVPFSVLGARNLMGANRLTLAVYTVARMIMNILRSIEPLIMAVVAVVWVGQGPFAGLIALTLHTVAALGKLFSEAIEDIEPGPVEAVRATGASWLQQVVYAVLPQVVPPFTAFTVYRWDINVRMSTVIGFVGGGGIGFLLNQWITMGAWSAAATAILAIAVVVIALDFVSAALRRRIETGQDLVPTGPGCWRLLRPAVALGLVLFTAWSWRTAQVDVPRMARDAAKMRPILGELLSPNLTSAETVTQTARVALVIPCGAAEAVPVAPGGGGPTLSFAAECADAGDRVALAGRGFAPASTVKLRWLLPDGRPFPAGGEVVSGADGSFMTQLAVRPLLARQGEAAGAPLPLEATAFQPTGARHVSQPARTTLNLLVETLLMALMASTLGALVAFPLSFLAARNVAPRNPVGNAAYYGTRLFLNVLRAVEPIILAVIFALWVGFGSPFAGVLALAVVTVASLGKLFSEAIEDIDAGPLEAVWATGARRLQVIVYAVVPQVVLAFLSFGIYHWDINVRMSTVVGFVGGGGIGFQLREWMNSLQWGNAAVAILGIVLVVSAMDLLSARLRQRLSAGGSGAAGEMADRHVARPA